MSKIYIYASEIATIINKNPYNVLTGFNRIVNKFAKDHIIIIKDKLEHDDKKIKRSIQELIKQPQTETIIKECNILKKQEIIIKNNIENIEKSTTTDQQKIHKVIPNYIPDTKLAPKIQKQELRKEIQKKGIVVPETLIENFINKSYGTEKEESAIEMFEKKFNVTLDTSQTFYKYDIVSENTKHQYFIGGRLDGIYKNEYIVEIKNRMRGFFSAIKDYEKCQIYTYMIMTGLSHAKLVECFKGTIKTTSVSCEESYKNEILGALDIFVKAIDNFLQNSDDIQNFLVMNDLQKTKFIHKLYLDDINNFYNECDSESSVECMFE
jgi:hypothetical protein